MANFIGWQRDEEDPSRWVTEKGLLHESFWRPTTNIVDAWLVAKELTRLGDFLIAKDRNSDEWEAELTIIGNDYLFYDAAHKSEAMAICLLALEVIGEDVEQRE